MKNYIFRRLLLLPLTMLAIILVNFIIINLAPGDPVSITQISQEGASRKADKAMAFGLDDRYLQFREFYGLTLPILFNLWPFTSKSTVQTQLWQLVHKKYRPEDSQEMTVKNYDTLRINFGDRSRYIMPILLEIIEDPKEESTIRNMAGRFFVRGGTRQGFVGANLSEEQKNWNRVIAKNNQFLLEQLYSDAFETKKQKFREWYEENKQLYQFQTTFKENVLIFFTDTRFYRYMSRVLTLDFGTLRNDENKTVISEVIKRLKYSLTLSIIPLMVTLILCGFFGFMMAYYHYRWPDYSFNFLFLVLYAIPIFVVGPFLIEKVALNGKFPFTDTPIPISGFTSPEDIYKNLTSFERLIDVFQHIALPLTAIIYGSLAAQTRLSRTAALETLRQDYVRTAKAKGLHPFTILSKHVGRNAGITIATSVAASLGAVLGGSLIIETLFGINGFGKFFYDAVINRDYNVIMFSALASAFLTLAGYLVADIAYTLLDPRVTLE